MAEMRRIPNFEQILEQESSHEREYELNFDVITISGRSGTGKTHTGKLLSERYGIPFIKVGDDFFRQKQKDETGVEPLGFMERDEEHDKFVDERQKELIRNAIANRQPIILEGRLAGFLASEVLREPRISKDQRERVVRILTTAKNDVRFHRIREREIDKKMEAIGLSREEVENDPSLSLTFVKRKTVERERGDLERWRIHHKTLGGIDPFSPANKDNKKRPIYNFSQTTNTYTVEEFEHVIHSVLLTSNRVKEIKKENGFPQSGVVFKA